MLVERHDVANPEALAYLEQRLREIGVLAALQRAGFESGDEVRIGDHDFELHRARVRRVNVAPDRRPPAPRLSRRNDRGGEAWIVDRRR